MTPNSASPPCAAATSPCEQCCAWAARHPDQVPLLNGEFEFIAAYTPEARE